LNLNFFTPGDFGPELGGIYPFGDFRVSLLGGWTNGYYFTWTGGGSIPGIVNNVQWRDSWNFDMRFSKGFRFGDMLNLELIVDISNVFNYKYMTQYGFVDGKDYEAYMRSLHLPSGTEGLQYINIPGEDKPGDFRTGGEFVPIVPVTDINNVANPIGTAVYWESTTGRYMENTGNGWVPVSQGRMDEILDNKQYIDMPNQAYLTFLNPRNIYFGLRLSFEIF
jgi:hypothetical protein